MVKFFSNRYAQGTCVGLFFVLLTAIILRGFSLTGFNFWTDFSGNIDLVSYFSKSQYLWSSNQLGTFQFSSPANLWLHLFVKAMYSMFGLTHGTYFVFFFLVLSGFGSAYYMVKSITHSLKYSVLISLFLILNPLYMYYLFGTGTITFVAAFTGLYLALAFFENYRKNKEKKYFIGLLLSSVLVSHPFLFPFFCLIFSYLLWVKIGWKTAALFLAWVFALHIYWILPFISSFIFKGQALLGSYTSGLVDTFSMNGLYQYSFLFLGRSYQFISQFYGHATSIIYLALFAFWILVIRLSLVNNEKDGTVIYWPIIILLLVFSVGPRQPFGILYSYLFSRFSFFSNFRSYQNVFIVLLPLVSYVGILAAKQKEIYLKALSAISVIILLLFVFFANSQQITKGSNVPSDYFEAGNIVNDDQTSGRVLLLPISEYDYYSWDKPTEDKYFLEAFFPYKGISFYRPTVDDPKLRNIYDELYNNPDFNYQDLSNLGIQYILVRKDLTHEEDGYFQKFTGSINTSDASLVLDTKNLSLYKINNPEPYIIAQGATFQRVSPVKYNVTLNNVQPGATITLKELNNTGWGLFPSSANISSCSNFTNIGSEKECPPVNQALSVIDVKYLGEHAVSSSEHASADGYTNSWTISQNDINSLPSSSYKKNEDGSYNINLTIFFKPQAYSYLGLIISGLSVIAMLAYIIIRKVIKK